MIWELLHPGMTAEHLGLIPAMLSDADPRPASEQINAHYQHGGGWRSKSGFTFNPKTYSLKYPGDPVMRPLARSQLRDETILFYQFSWIVIMQPSGAYDVARID
jgi:hypothetical protein